MIAYREINEVEPHGATGRHAGGSLANDLGYIVGGHRPGPNALVAGYQPVADLVFDALLALPSLPWIRGTLYLGASRRWAAVSPLAMPRRCRMYSSTAR